MRNLVWRVVQIGCVVFAIYANEQEAQPVPLGAAVLAGAFLAFLVTVTVTFFLNLPGRLRRWQTQWRAHRIDRSRKFPGSARQARDRRQ